MFPPKDLALAAFESAAASKSSGNAPTVRNQQGKEIVLDISDEDDYLSSSSSDDDIEEEEAIANEEHSMSKALTRRVHAKVLS